MVNLSLHNSIIILSFFASIAGVALLTLDKRPAKDEMEAADNTLMLMTFAYWLVYCVSFGLQKLISPEWETMLLSVKLTGVIAYLLTASCVLSLPLNRVSVRQVE
ncbi:MAG: hypothetical protein IGS48_23465 [Oscillatoriales cyanobacterium C42_A2020_001]|nr:hypothetical protein [Leptolyngbyaceae cyanobacterium C42_A2020_001]